MKYVPCAQFLVVGLMAGIMACSSSAAPDCCAVPPEPGSTACCTEELPPAPAWPSESIYQLDFPFTTDAGTSLRLAELHGQPVIMAMFFAQCGYACPLLVHDMKEALKRLSPEQQLQVKLLLVTFDTKRDTAAALRTYRETHELDERWVLLRTSPADTRTLAMVMGVQYRQEPSGDFSHANLITLLDRTGVIAHRRQGLQGGLAGLAEATVRAIAAN